MSKASRLLLVAAAVLIAVATRLPVWRISLLAPQYPEGMGMVIRFNTIEGAKENDLENINHLNHYIGMRVIEPADMPELRFMPLIALAVAGAGVIAALIGRRAALCAWASVLGAAGIAGMADFWWRTYTFGHSLDFAHAAIQIPGLAYQPPLIGVKQIANFTASAWPASGGMLIGVAVLLTLAAIWRSRATRPTDKPAARAPRDREASSPAMAA